MVSAGLKLSTSSQCIKYLMFIFNLLFVITGIILISIGSVIHGVYYNYQHFLDDKFFSVPTLLITIGAIIFFIAFFGCCGAVRENYCMVVTFSTLMVLVFILELSAGISGYALRASATEMIQGEMINSLNNYKTSKEVATIWDEIQTDFSCCGVNNRSDWILPLNGPNSTQDLPLSCCEIEIGKIGNTSCNLTTWTVYNTTCLPAFGNFIKAHAVQLGGVGLGIAFVQAMGVWFSIFLARSIKNSYNTV